MFDAGWEDGVSGPTPTWSHAMPGPELAAALTSCEPLDLVDDGGFDVAERLGAWEALAAWATAHQLREAAEYLAARQARVRQCSRDLEDERLAVARELATYARVAPATGEHRVEHAHALTERLPGTLAALEAGKISYSHARVVIDQTGQCIDAMARRVDADLWNRPERHRTPTQLRETVRRIVARLDPENLRRRAEQAQQQRGVRYWSDDDGATGVVQLRLPAPEARGVYAVVDHIARRVDDDPDAEARTLDNRRADVLRDLVLDGALGDACVGEPAGAAEPEAAEPEAAEPEAAEPEAAEPEAAAGPPTNAGPRVVPADAATPSGAAACGCAPSSSPIRTQVRITVPWHTLAGLSDMPGELEGHGPIPADQARAMALGADATWQRLLTDPVAGSVARLDTRRYRPPRRLQEFVRSRNMTCSAPGCRVPAARCDLDHVVPYDHDAPTGDGGAGRTIARNLRPECRRDHHLKTHTGWRCDVVADPDAAGAPPGGASHAEATQWTSPSGRTWLVRAPEVDDPWPTAARHHELAAAA